MHDSHPLAGRPTWFRTAIPGQIFIRRPLLADETQNQDPGKVEYKHASSYILILRAVSNHEARGMAAPEFSRDITGGVAAPAPAGPFLSGRGWRLPPSD